MTLNPIVPLALLLWLAAAGAAGADTGLSETVDLSGPFHTRTPWTLDIRQGPPDADGDTADVHICFSHAGNETCQDDWTAIPDDGETISTNRFPHFVPPAYDYDCCLFNNYDHYEIVRPSRRNAPPVLAIYLWEFSGGPGEARGPVVFTYQRGKDRFVRVFTAVESGNVNSEVRVIANGPLAGDIAENEETIKWPFPYKILLFRLTMDGHYVKALDYLGQSRWGDGNELGVIDAEMPVLMRRMGVWRAGQALPVPVSNPEGCEPIIFKYGLEWCPPFAAAGPQ